MSGKDTKSTATIAENAALAKDKRGFRFTDSSHSSIHFSSNNQYCYQ